MTLPLPLLIRQSRLMPSPTIFSPTTPYSRLTLFGGEGNDTLTEGSGSDRFLFQVGQGTDTITDFEAGVDYFLLAGGLTFEQLDISQSNNDTLISITSNGEVLATLNEVSANLLTQTDFITI
jgi:Ca2+-binding RTX toxin-like protein